MFVLAHLSDPHVASDLRLGWGDLVGKRLLGFVSWKMRRRHIHRLQVLNGLADDVLLQRPDHVVVTGDITNISLPAEFPAAARWLARLGRPEQVSIIPGNHDAYVALSWERSWAHWGDYMRSDAEGSTDNSDVGRFPFLRRRKDLAIVGLSTAVVSGPGLALGRLGADQLRSTRTLLDRLRSQGAFRVVLLHHPPVTAHGDHHKRLTDARAFTAMLMDAGAELVLHGHDHQHRLRMLPSQWGDVLSVGAASASAAPVRGHAPAQYNLYRIARCDGGWTIEVCVRGLDAAQQRVVELHRHRLTIPRAHAQHSPHTAATPAATNTVGA